MRLSAVLAMVLVTLGSSASASERTLTLDAGATEIRFTLGATLHSVHGTVAVVDGEIRFDAEGGPASGEVVIDATSAETGNDGRDRDMHRKVLESDRFGTFVLRPTELVGELAAAGTSAVELRGELSIHGDVHEVALLTEATVDGDRLTGTTAFEVPYVAWGMKNPSKLLLRVDKFVTVEISLAGTLTE